MKKILTSISTIIVVFSAIGQNTAVAEQKFQDYFYLEAAEEYERLVRKGDTSLATLQRLGDTYYFNADMTNAVHWYGQLFSKYERSLSTTYIFRYVHALKGTGNYKLAKALMKIYQEKAAKEGFNVAQFKDNDMALDKIRNEQPQFIISHLSLNTPNADFGTTYYNDKIVFASSRDSMNLHTRVYEWNKQPYLNLYEADTLQLGSDLITVTPFGNGINSKYHEAVATFNKEGTIMYFTRNNYTQKILERDDEGTNHLKIYKSQLEGGIWAAPIEVPFNSTNYSVGQPSLSPDGKRLFFVSDMPGGHGATDIYYVIVYKDGSFSEPINLGDQVNTSGREMFPFVGREKLYLASDGHLGLGGLDIFELDINNDLSLPINLGPGLNSQHDDFAYIVDEQTQRGYFSSNRDGGYGDDDIYSFQRLQPKCEQSAKGTLLRKANDQPVVNATVELVDDLGNTLETATTDANGAFKFNVVLSCDNSFKVHVSKKGYKSFDKEFETTDILEFENNLPLVITKELNKLIVEENGILKIQIDDIYFDLNKSNIRPDAAQELNKIVEIMKEYPKMVIKIESHTDSRGSDSYNARLSDSRAKSTGDYIISQGIALNRIESAIGYGEKHLLNQCDNGVKCSNSEHDVNRRSEFIIVSME
ncbi:OmpA family protein [uncultured Croceitalea sp.]|uniref:OmpA family protein n=1 Tax=uncultured Croceitalea sp. TaxID=1798908 RepID=UPI0033056A1E